MKIWENFMHELDDFKVGMLCLTPSGRRVVVKRLLGGYSKKDCFERILLQYEGGDKGDVVTLQPHQLTIVKEVQVIPQTVTFTGQCAFDF